VGIFVAKLSDGIKRKLAALAEEFTATLPERMDRIDDCVNIVLEKNACLETVKELHMLTHKLSGSGATFGYEELSEIAGQMEYVLAGAVDRKGSLGKRDKDRIRTLYAALQREWDTIEPASAVEKISDQVERVLVPESCDEDVKKLLSLSDETAPLPDDLLEQLGFYGFSFQHFAAIEELEKVVAANPRRLLLVNTDYLDNEGKAQAVLAVLKQKNQPYFNIIFVSKHNDFDTRLRAVRAGGDAFFLLPVDAGRLIDKIDSLTSKREHDPYHILIVDDDPEQVSFHALLLQQAGMITSVALDPKQVVKVLVEAKPELILMDMYMPGCSGMELASIIRQQEAFVSIPIVFLSVEKDLGKQLEAIRLGGDDFLTKPIKEEHLIASIANRAERARSLRYLMERDSLTGLLNHSNLKEQLGREMLRAGRTGSEICFAMIDVDHFKQVNDTYGHLTGDRVLKGLARLLQERLRSTDIIGRYGGEEFAVILLNTSPENAKKIIDEIRINFSQIKQQAEKEEFYVTFSCGVAGYPDFSDSASINESADKALYEAKEGGRNRIVIASSS
jgi:diguanylate cyclase (GGDEF)-like protein